MAWILLIAAGLLETGWALGMKASGGLDVMKKPGASAATVAAMIVSFYLLALATRALPVGTAYAVWVGIGAFGAVIGGVLLFQEPLTAPRLFFLGLLITAIVGLKATGS